MLIFALQKKQIMNFLKGTKLYSIFTGTCPVCHQGEMYVESNPFKLSQIMKMHERCSHCGLKFKIEPSFFFGAMYVSYGIGVAISVASFVITHFILNLSIHISFITIIAALVLLFPYIIRISRNVWINLFLNYKKDAAQKKG